MTSDFELEATTPASGTELQAEFFPPPPAPSEVGKSPPVFSAPEIHHECYDFTNVQNGEDGSQKLLLQGSS